MKWKISFGLIVVLVLIQFVPINKNESKNAKEDWIGQEAINDQQLKTIEILETACFDCHSNHTSYPWYNSMAPISWYLAKHIQNGKKKLNFSEWTQYSKLDQKYAAKEIIEVLEENRMPLWTYTIIHTSAKLGKEEKQSLLDYFRAY